MTTRHFFLTQPKDIPSLWHEVKPLIDKVLARDDFYSMTTDDVLSRVLDKRQQLWVGIENGSIFTAVVSRIAYYPNTKILQVITWSTVTGYGYDDWIALIVDTLKGFGSNNECFALQAWCREGLAKKLDWEQKCVVVSTLIKPKQKRKHRRRSKKHG